MPGTPLSTEKNRTVPKIKVVLPSWKLTYVEYYDPDKMHFTWPGKFSCLRGQGRLLTK